MAAEGNGHDQLIKAMGAVRMREKLEAQIKALLDRHRKQEHSRRAAVILSAWAKPNIAFSNYTAPAGVIAASDKVPYGESVTISSADKWTNTCNLSG